MTEPAQKTESLRDYTEVLGSPDPVTTDRMRARLDDYLVKRQRRRGRQWWLWIGIAGVLGAAVAVAVLVGDDETLLSADSDRVVEIGDATLLLRPGSSIRPDEHDDARVELMRGEVEVIGHAFVVRSGEFEVHAQQEARFSVRHTAGVPVVTVIRGHATLFGPDLPASGIRILASP